MRNNKEKSGRPNDGMYSETGSVQSTPSPAQRTSMSPGSELPPMNMHRPGDYYMGNSSIPPHVRGDFQQASPRSSPTATSPSLSTFNAPPHSRPSMTSHPSAYGPPQPLEPPANNDHRPSSVGGGSPHMGSVGWASPTHSLPSPGSPHEYSYPEPSGSPYAGNMPHQMYFPNSTIRRPGSTEPENYEMKPRVASGDTWTTPV